MKILLILLITGCSILGNKQDQDIIIDVIDDVHQAKIDGEKAVVIFDLDDTLFSTRSRTLKIIREFVKIPEMRALYKDDIENLEKIKKKQIEYKMADTFKLIKIKNDKLLKKLMTFWQERIFTNKYIASDRQIKGASYYVNRLRNLGAHVIYLTGRDRPRMEKGTRKLLIDNNFPTSNGSTLLMKPNKDISDKKFKQVVFSKVEKYGKVLAVFENEAENLNMMADYFPKAKIIFLDTISKSEPSTLTKKAVWIKHFKLKH